MTNRVKPFRLCACLLNISEAHNLNIVESVATSALLLNEKADSSVSEGADVKTARTAGQEPSSDTKVSVLNIFSDKDYNRSVITVVAQAQHIGDSVASACCKAYELIDLSQHRGGHPRLGAVDLVPIHPLSEDVSLEECGNIARGIARQVTAAVPGTSGFLFGHADVPQLRGLVARRKQMRWFSGCHDSSYAGTQQDIGAAPSPRYGLTGFGAIPYVMNCNVTIDTTDIDFGREIASRIRASSPGGLPGVQSMAFPHEGRVEIACNVEGVSTDVTHIPDTIKQDMICSFGTYYHVPGWLLEKHVSDIAKTQGVTTVGTAIVGFSPEEARTLAWQALTNGQAEVWRTRTTRMM